MNSFEWISPRDIVEATGAATATVAAAMVHLARDLGISVVAEGVETPAQAAALARMGCLYAQGYLFGRPLPASDTTELLAAGHVEAVPSNPAPVPPPSDLHRAGRLSVPSLRGPRPGAAEGRPDGQSPVGIRGARPARGRPGG